MTSFPPPALLLFVMICFHHTLCNIYKTFTVQCVHTHTHVCMCVHSSGISVEKDIQEVWSSPNILSPLYTQQPHTHTHTVRFDVLHTLKSEAFQHLSSATRCISLLLFVLRASFHVTPHFPPVPVIHFYLLSPLVLCARRCPHPHPLCPFIPSTERVARNPIGCMVGIREAGSQ